MAAACDPRLSSCSTFLRAKLQPSVFVSRFVEFAAVISCTVWPKERMRKAESALASRQTSQVGDVICLELPLFPSLTLPQGQWEDPLRDGPNPGGRGVQRLPRRGAGPPSRGSGEPCNEVKPVTCARSHGHAPSGVDPQVDSLSRILLFNLPSVDNPPAPRLFAISAAAQTLSQLHFVGQTAAAARGELMKRDIPAWLFHRRRSVKMTPWLTFSESINSRGAYI